MVVSATLQNTLANLPPEVVRVYGSTNSSSAPTTKPYSPAFAAAETGVIGYMIGGEYYSQTALAISIVGAITLLVGIIQALWLFNASTNTLYDLTVQCTNK